MRKRRKKPVPWQIKTERQGITLYLDQRSWKILKLIADSPVITGKELEHQLGATRKQIGYSIEKINEYLTESGMMKIQRLRTGKFQVPAVVIEEFRSREPVTKEMVYIYSDKERLYLLLLMLLCHDEELSTYHFTDELKISKNTLLLDMKKLQERIDPYHVTIYYSRKSGYTMLGSEFDKRELLVLTIRKIIRFPKGRLVIEKISKLEKETLMEIRRNIEEIEKNLQIKFTDERVSELPYILYLIILRIKRNRLLEELPEAFNHIAGTREYSAVAVFANQYEITGNLERVFLTAQIQISNIHSLKFLNHEAEEMMLNAAQKVIANFESICCIQFFEKDQLLEALIQHWKPAYYRIRYQYHLETSILEMVLPQYAYLHEIVKKSISPFEKILQKEIPDEELVYFTVLFGSWLRREGRYNLLEQRKRAVVVCANGISVSNFLFISLKELFPEMEFVTWLSVRDFIEFNQDYDIVFTTQHLETKKLQFLVKPFLNEQSKQKFKRKVLQELEGIDLQGIQVSQLLEVIEQYATVHSKDQLLKSLYRCIHEPNAKKIDTNNSWMGDQTPELSELLTDQTILIWNEPQLPDWKQAITKAAGPLLENRSIEPGYVSVMIQLIEEKEPYIMVAPGVIIAHAGINDGVNQVGMSVMQLPEAISIKGYMEADLIIVLGTPDKTIHLNALFQLNDLLEDEDALQFLRTARTTEQIIEFIRRRGD